MKRIVLACLTLAACSSTPPENFDFPQGFLFGTAIAGFQADMGCPSAMASCVDPNSDWYVWVTKAELVNDPSVHVTGEPPTDGPGFYELYTQDLDRAKNELGNNAFRMSIEWSRVFPTSLVGIEDEAAIKAAASPDALAFYHGVFAAMKARGITPLVTLNHYALPTWIHDAYGCHVNIDTCSPRGWLDHDLILHEIAKYAGFVAREFGGEVDRFATLNEPLTAVAIAGFLIPSDTRSNPPGIMLKFAETKTAAMTMIEAHARMYDAVKTAAPNVQVGIVYNMEAVAPTDPTEPLDVQGAKNLSYLLNEVFINAITTGDLDANLDGTTVHRDDLGNRLDFLGINYYARIVATGSTSPFPQLSPLLTVSITSLTNQDYAYPKGIYEVITLAGKWGRPIYITETGAADPNDDTAGPSWLVDTLAWTKRAINEGANVKGYFWWTFMDNYEWNHGMTIKMGMYAVDPKDPTKTRHARQTVGTYSRIATTGTIPADLLSTYPAPR